MPNCSTAVMRLVGPAAKVELMRPFSPVAGSVTHRSRGTDSSWACEPFRLSTMIVSVRAPPTSSARKAPALGSSAKIPSRESVPTMR